MWHYTQLTQEQRYDNYGLMKIDKMQSEITKELKVGVLILPAFSGQLIKPPFYSRSRPGFDSQDRSDDVADYKTLLCNQK